MLVKDVMSSKVVFADPNSSVYDAVKLMASQNISGLVVGSSTKLMGVITMKDIFTKLVAADKNTKDVTVRQYMSSPALTINQLTPLEKAALLMSEKKIKRLVVVDLSNHVVGIITQMDLVSNVPDLLHVMFDTWVKPTWR